MWVLGFDVLVFWLVFSGFGYLLLFCALVFGCFWVSSISVLNLFIPVFMVF